mmetsp:Transcript_8758/g.8064  ORF Transcript_8758/g.8064 Transcript_8758/m.8064 type:complete len:105 (+) Transcript_8758:1723-2037(+)
MEGIYMTKYGKPNSTIAPNRGPSARNQSEGRAKFRLLQHNYMEEQKNEGDSTIERDDLSTVFGGMQKAMGKIEELREKEREKHRVIQRNLNTSSSMMDRGRMTH